MSTTGYKIDKEIPVIKDVDVVVIGSGPGGIGAAVTAARNGARTVLVERHGFPGGMATAGEVTPFMQNHVNGVCMDKPVYQEWLDSIKNYIPEEFTETIKDNPSNERMIPKEAAILGAEDLLLDAGVEILYHHFLADCIVKDKQIESAILVSKSGYTAVKAKVFIDCSGDADLAAKAGCEVEIGDDTGGCQPMTTCFKLANVADQGPDDDYKRHCMHNKEFRDLLTEKYVAAKERGEIDCPRDTMLAFKCYEKDIVHFNSTRVIQKSAINGEELSEAEIIGRQQVRQIYKMLKNDVPQFKHAKFYSMGAQIGIRESRRVIGRAYMTREDFTNQSKFDDAIARCNYPIDIHSPYGKGTELVFMDLDKYYEVPYGCIVARDIDNLMIGGRPISVDYALHSSIRVMPPAVTIGQAAGMAATMSIKANTIPAELDGKDVRAELVKFGAFL